MRLFLAFTLFLFVAVIRLQSMQDEYSSQWKSVEEHLEKQRPKSALEIVQKIYNKARADRNEQQIIKSASYRIGLIAQTEEDSELLLVKELKQEILKATSPLSRSLFESLLGEVYWNFYTNNSWKFAQRTQTQDKKTDDFRSWDAKTLRDTARLHYLASLSNDAVLKSALVKDYGLLLTRNSGYEFYRPTMFDILSHRTIEFLQQSQTLTSQASSEISDVHTLGSLDDFIGNTDYGSSSEAQKAIQLGNHTYSILALFQELLRFHRSDKQQDALIDADILRLQFARTVTANDNKDSLYFNSLEKIADKFSSSPSSTFATYSIAQEEFNQEHYNRAMQLCNAAIKHFPNSRGGMNCKSLISQIQQKQLSVVIEENILPDKPFIASVSYRNLSKIYFRIVKIENYSKFLKERRQYRTEIPSLNQVLKIFPLVQQWSQVLPENTDYQSHIVDVRSPGLPLGHYALVCSPVEDFSDKKNIIIITPFSVTRLSLQSQELKDGSKVFHVHDAQTGKPISGVTAKIFTIDYTSTTSSESYSTSKESNTEGMFTIKNGSLNSRNFRVELSYDKDILSVDYFYLYERSPEQNRIRTLFFTDRQLYRPGQTIYFKGIIYENNNEQAINEVVKNEKTTVYFYNTNSKEIAKLELRTNEFGSFSGSFIAPNNGLLGRMFIRNESGNNYFRVEEYKRPKFEVSFNPVKDNIRLGEQVAITGKAMGFAGANIGGATVQYHVTRSTRYPYYRWGKSFRYAQTKEISHGTTETNSVGEFTVQFPAMPDRSVDKKDLPVFSYSISADVTDINGETHSTETTVSAGYVSLELNLSIGGVQDNSFSNEELILGNQRFVNFALNLSNNLIITSTNTNHTPISATGKVAIQQLKQPERLEVLRPRLLPSPDKFIMTMNEFTSSFPNDIYQDDDNPQTWKIATTIESKEFHTDSTGNLITGTNKILSAGMYRITVSAIDVSGTPVEVVRHVIIFDSTAPRTHIIRPITYFPLKINCQPKESASFLYGTSFKSAYVLYQIEHRGEIIEQKQLQFSDELRRFTIPIEEKHRGGFSVHLTIIHDGRMYATRVNINVPWSNKNLNIKTATFRDKLAPGAKERWRLILKNNDGKAPIAEMVARLYDASLDAIVPNQWKLFTWQNFNSNAGMTNNSFVTGKSMPYEDYWNKYEGMMQEVQYQQLNLPFRNLLTNNYFGYKRKLTQSDVRGSRAEASQMRVDGLSVSDQLAGEYSNALGGVVNTSVKVASQTDKLRFYSDFTVSTDNSNTTNEDLQSVKTRTNFNETAFFFPQLLTDTSGSIIIDFTIPEALTRWKMTAFAHTADMQTGEIERTTITQKDLMIEPNMPRFLRSGDTITLPVKITNLSDKSLAGAVELTILDAYTMKPISKDFSIGNQAKQPFTVSQSSSVSASWRIVVPDSYQAIVYRIAAKSGNFSDGEEAPIPILPNRMLVTETLPLWINNTTGTSTVKSFEFTKLKESGKSTTLRNHKLTLEITSNPAWYAIQALPLLMEFPYECAEQTFNRFYANSIASFLVNSKPNIKQIFDRWKESPDALTSNLEKNQELKSLLLEETPWVMQGQNETERKKRVSLLFDLNRMSYELQRTVDKLAKMQQPSGGFGWFNGMNENSFITNYIIAGFGHLNVMGITTSDPITKEIISKALNFSDEMMNSEYQTLKSMRDFNSNNNNISYSSYTSVQYLYARSYFTDIKVKNQYMEAFNFWMGQAQRYWQNQGLMNQAMIALAMQRFGEKSTAKEIVRSIKERALQSEELGMYWKENESGWMWYNAPIETQALLIEAYDEIIADSKSVELMKVWLLKQKQVQDWKTTKATAEACYALLSRGTDWLDANEQVGVTIGGKKLDVTKIDNTKPEAGTGYFKTSWNSDAFTPTLGDISLSKSTKGIAWGGMYWQYYEQLDRITPHTSPLSLKRKIYRRTTTDNGFELAAITPETPLKVGDMIVVKIELSTDRDMEYIHLKDMRGAGFEQIAQLSGYKWQDGLGYYQSPRDGSMNFFIGWMPKGIYSLEYPLRVTHDGTFSMGISTLQSMYAPEFSSHSAGEILHVGK